MEQFWRVVGNSHETGDTQLVVFDLERQTVIISYSRNYENENGEKVSEKAFTRSPIFVDMGRLWWDF